MSRMFELVEVEGRGKIVIAQQDLRPGHLLIVEPPILHVEDSFIREWEQKVPNPDFARIFAAYTKSLEQCLGIGIRPSPT